MAFEYATKIYLDAANGDDTTGDGTLGNPYQFFDTSAVKTLVEAAPIYTYNVIFLSSSSENINLNTSAWGNLVYEPAVKFTAANGARFSGTGIFTYIINGGSRFWGVWFVGFDISGYTQATYAQAYTSACVFDTCRFEGVEISVASINRVVYINSHLKDVVLANDSSAFSTNNLHSLSGCTFDNVTTVEVNTQSVYVCPSAYNFGSVGGITYKCERNHFKNMNVVLVVHSAASYSDLYADNYENVRGTYRLIESADPVLIADLVPFDSVAAMQAEYLAVFGTATTLYENETFKTIPVDGFGFPQDETGQYLNRAQGVNNYAISQVTPLANADYTFVTDHYVSNKVNPNPLVYVCELPLQSGRFIRRVLAHITRNGVVEQLGADGALELSVEASSDGVTYGVATTYLSGIDASTLAFDLATLQPPSLGALAARFLRISLQPTGANFGELELYGVTAETCTLGDLVGTTTPVQLDQKGTGNGFLIAANYSFLIPEALRSYFTVPSKTSYTFDEIEAEALANSNVSILNDGLDTTQIIAVQVQTLTKLTTIYTFEK